MFDGPYIYRTTGHVIYAEYLIHMLYPIINAVPGPAESLIYAITDVSQHHML